MRRGPTGEWATTSVVGDEPVRAFVPRPLPPDPPLQIEGALRDALDGALLALGRLDSVTTLLPDTALFLYTYVRQEAVLSSQIEGTRSTPLGPPSLRARRGAGRPPRRRPGSVVLRRSSRARAPARA